VVRGGDEVRSLADARNLGGEVFVVVGSWFVVGEWGPLPAGRGSVTGVGAGERSWLLVRGLWLGNGDRFLPGAARLRALVRGSVRGCWFVVRGWGMGTASCRARLSYWRW
jgi:hypothetical protein